MGKRLRKEPVLPKVIVSSPANRALTTARLVATEIDYPSLDIQEQQRLYHASEEVILEIIKTLDDSLDAVMVVGHNPGLTEFANALLDEEISNIPTAGLVGAKLNVHQWKDMRWGSGEMFLFEYPKKK